MQGVADRVHEHDAAAVGLDPLEDQLHDPLQQLVDVQRVADGQRRAVHDLQVAPRPGEPGVLRHVVGPQLEDAAPLGLRKRADDPRLVCGPLGRSNIDRAREFFLGLVRRAGEEHQRAAELHLIAALQDVLTDALAVDERAVGTVQIAEFELRAAAADFGVVPRDFGVVQLQRVRRITAHAEGFFLQLEAGSLIVSADHEQRRHGRDSDRSWLGRQCRPNGGQALRATGCGIVSNNSSILRIRGP